MTGFDDWDDVLCHHGVRGQKWGFRRYQNEDGSLTAEGMARYGVKGEKKAIRKELNRAVKQYRKDWRKGTKEGVRIGTHTSSKELDKRNGRLEKYDKEMKKLETKINKLTKTAEGKGYKVSYKAKKVSTTTAGGKDYVKSAIFGALASGGLAFYHCINNPSYTKGQAYSSILFSAGLGAIASASVTGINSRATTLLPMASKYKVK